MIQEHQKPQRYALRVAQRRNTETRDDDRQQHQQEPIMTNTNPSTPTPWTPALLALDRRGLLDLQRQIRSILTLYNDETICNNANVIAVRLTVPEKACLQALAAMSRRTLSHEVRAAIRAHLRTHQHTLNQLGGIPYAALLNEAPDRTDDV